MYLNLNNCNSISKFKGLEENVTIIPFSKSAKCSKILFIYRFNATETFYFYFQRICLKLESEDYRAYETYF